MTELEELTQIIREERYQIMAGGNWIETTPSEELAKIIMAAGFGKLDNQILVTEGMVKAALLAYYTSVFELRELETAEPNARSNMIRALYAAFHEWKGVKSR